MCRAGGNLGEGDHDLGTFPATGTSCKRLKTLDADRVAGRKRLREQLICCAGSRGQRGRESVSGRKKKEVQGRDPVLTWDVARHVLWQGNRRAACTSRGKKEGGVEDGERIKRVLR